MKKIQCLFLAAVVLVAATQTGCAKAPVSVGEEKSSMLKGTQTVLQTDPVTVTAAAKAVADEMQLTVEKNVASGLDGKVIAKSANRMKLVVVTKAYGPGSVLVTVRAGGFGDAGVQKQVLERIKAKLPATAYTPAPKPAAPATVAQQPAQPPHSSTQTMTDSSQLPF
jgi:hypothetical protein